MPAGSRGVGTRQTESLRHVGDAMRNTLCLLALCTAAALPARPQDAGQERARPPSQRNAASGDKEVVVSGTAPATAAGVRILEQGGNAADAGAATLLALSATAYTVFCIGGEVPLIVYDAAKKDVKVLAWTRRGAARPRGHRVVPAT